MQEETIYYKSPVGALRITGTDTHINSVCFVNTMNREQTDESKLPFNKSIASIAIQSCADQLDAYFNGQIQMFDLPLQQPGTDFQQSVWAALINIPYGKTTSYLHLSKQLGDVKAIRAVGSANGKNNIAIIVPCHRVIGSGGDMVGYAGDLWRKKWLLAHEAAHSGVAVQLGLSDKW